MTCRLRRHGDSWITWALFDEQDFQTIRIEMGKLLKNPLLHFLFASPTKIPPTNFSCSIFALTEHKDEKRADKANFRDHSPRLAVSLAKLMTCRCSKWHALPIKRVDDGLPSSPIEIPPRKDWWGAYVSYPSISKKGLYRQLYKSMP